MGDLNEPKMEKDGTKNFMGQICTNEKTKKEKKFKTDNKKLTPKNITSSLMSLNMENYSTSEVKEITNTKEDREKKTSQNYKKLFRICLLGSRESGKSTILEQIRKISNDKPTDFELHLRKSFIYDNCVNSMRKILEYTQSSNILLTNNNNKKHFDLIIKEERMHGNPFAEAEYQALKCLWQDKTIQDLYNKKADYCLKDSTKYFMEQLDRIYEKNFEPSYDDLLMAYIPTVGIQKSFFSINDCPFQILEIGGSKLVERKWLQLLDCFDAIIFCLAISIYDHKMLNEQVEFDYSMALLDQLCKEKKFYSIPLYIFLNECDIFREKLLRIPLSNYFPDYKGSSEDEALKYMRNFVRKRCEINRPYMTNVKIYFTCAIDSNETPKLLENLLTKIIK